MTATHALGSTPAPPTLPAVQSDRLALAHQLLLCRTEQSVWRHWVARVRTAQAFAAGHLVSVVLLLSVGAQAMAWLME